MPFGVATAGRGWATKADVLNTLSLAKLKSWIKIETAQVNETSDSRWEIFDLSFI